MPSQNATGSFGCSPYVVSLDSSQGNYTTYVSSTTPGVGFTITSTNGFDTSTVAYIIFEPFV